MKIPVNLKHKPVICVENYENVDGKNAYHSNAKGLSLGLAQWNDRGNVEISAKVWRYTGGKWSRQSEELPIHRVLDLAILVLRGKQLFNDVYRQGKTCDPRQPLLDRIGIQGDAMTVQLCTENGFLKEDVELFFEAFAKDDEWLSERIRVLSGLIEALQT